MKIFIIPNPFDYHEEGEILVKAKNKEEAIIKVKAKYEEAEYDFQPDYDGIKEWDGDFYRNQGCDC